MFFDKKGTDKPIEIFVALFVILAVAMLILRMFSSQIEEKQRQLRDAADQAKVEQAKASLQQFCDARCSEAMDEAGVLNYCKSYIQEEIDINNNKIYTDYITSISLEGVCEDRVYCAQFKPCGALNMKTCVQRLCSYFQKNWGINDPALRTVELQKFLQPGECYASLTPEQNSTHWFARSSVSC